MAQMTTQQVMDAKGTAPARMYLIGLGHGIQAANVLMNSKGKGRFYCVSPGFSLVGDQYVSIFEQFIAKNPRLRPEPPQAVMMLALQDAFPCQ